MPGGLCPHLRIGCAFGRFSCQPLGAQRSRESYGHCASSARDYRKTQASVLKSSRRPTAVQAPTPERVAARRSFIFSLFTCYDPSDRELLLTDEAVLDCRIIIADLIDKTAVSFVTPLAASVTWQLMQSVYKPGSDGSMPIQVSFLKTLARGILLSLLPECSCISSTVCQ